jgi:spore maturation protein CgeB
VFVGSFSVEHSERIEFLEKVAALQPLEVWAHGIECLSPESSLRQRYHGKCWALDMYRVLHNSRIALNFHINTAGPYANNMRLFEATGVGTMLLTDAKSNLATMFKPGKEVVTYRSPEECAELIGYYLSHPAEREEIARAGQDRTLREHTYQQRMQELADILQSYLKAAGRGRRRAGV